MPINTQNSATMADLWESFSVEVMRKSSPPISQPELASVRRVFYAGMIGAFSALVINGSNDEAQAMKQLNAWREEAAEFLGEAKRSAQGGANMPSRNLLHKKRVDEFLAWCVTEKKLQIERRNTNYQIAGILPRNSKAWSYLYERNEMPEHVTVPDRLVPLVLNFLRSTKQKAQNV